jgi:hypothetical protein
MRSGPSAAPASNSTPSTNNNPRRSCVNTFLCVGRPSWPWPGWVDATGAIDRHHRHSDDVGILHNGRTTCRHLLHLHPSGTTVTLSAEQLKNAGIVTGKAERRSLGVLMPVQGVVDVPPQNLVSISAPLGGYLRSTDLLPGMEVQKGQTLAIMEDPRFIQLQQDYLVAEGKVAMLTQDFERQKALNASKTSSDKVLQEAHGTQHANGHVALTWRTTAA